MPCNPSDISFPIPDGPSGPAIPGFGLPFSLKTPNLNPFINGFPEDLMDILDRLKLLIPPGALNAQLNLNFGKDVFDAIMKLLDQFMPFLMLYKFFLPILKLIICIIEVLCAIPNPFKLIKAISNLFRNCIPDFLNLFPIFALIIMIISLLLLIIALIEYLVAQILKFIKILLRNILALQKAFSDGDANGVIAIANKIGSLLCIFQNLFVLLALFNIIIQVFKDILSMIFSIPPCDDSNDGDADNCCTPDVCPTIVKTTFTRNTGTFKYLSQVGYNPTFNPPLPAALSSFVNFAIRNETWQLYDVDQPTGEQFRNIFDGYDVPLFPKPIFFPTDSAYDANTDPRQAPYTLDLRVYYNPSAWGRIGVERYIQFKNCIMIKTPTTKLQEGDTVLALPVHTAVALLEGGQGYEDDGTTVLTGFAPNGITPISDQASLNNFLHTPDILSDNPVLSFTDGYVFSDVTYTFHPNPAPLIAKNLITLGCIPEVAVNRTFINTVFAGDVSLKTQFLNNIVNSPNFPNPAATQQCLATAIATLKGDLTANGVANFQTTTMLCLQKLKDDTNNALGQLVGVGFDPCQSKFTATPTTQFTSQAITIKADLNERNGISLVSGLSADVANDLSSKLKAHVTFGQVTGFTYDGYQSFTALLTSAAPGVGEVMVSFDNNIFCTNIIPADNTLPPEHTLQTIEYQFVYTPSGSSITADGDTDGLPRRDEGDLSRDGS